MDIPIQNIYYLLCYAWDKLDEKEIVNVDKIDSKDIMDLFARVLINGCLHLFKRGVDRNYIQFTQELKGIKSKPIFGEYIKRNLKLKASMVCEYDEFHHNILHNQIIKSTLRTLILFKGLDKKLKVLLVRIYRRFHETDDIKINSKNFKSVRLNRNNYFYDFLIKICQIIHENVLINEDKGIYKFMDFIRDENKMDVLFENFVRNFYKKEQNVYKVGVEIINWDIEVQPEGTTGLLPVMKTDISLESPIRKIIIDTKYYKETLTEHYNKERIHSTNLYQIFAYLKNVEAKGGVNKNCDGMLLYPTVSRELDEYTVIQGHKIMFKTVNLLNDWKTIEKRLLSLI
ncbi:MAG: 5-methylcytosine-specific restriction endonuclease system specificity protein McrC [Ignavibacteriae bacterium]|nr:MAG: 5-methylcytosine-specific restriction endonuclease system specificity protein McrC [Ignavibacteriota bacterium]